MLDVKNLTVYYGGIQALNDISFYVPEGSIVTLIGANGAGKSTTLRAISQLLKPRFGEILYMGESILGKTSKEVVERGVVHIPEGRHIFPDMTVYENLMAGAYLRKDKEGVKKDVDYVYTLFPRLQERGGQLAGTMSGGEQQMLAVARALMAKPKLLMMDEPSLGLAPLVVKDIFSTIVKINKEDGVTVLLIEQNAHMALKIADYAYVLETGMVGLSGCGRDLLENERVKELYLGLN